MVPVTRDNIPLELQHIDQWVMWREDIRDGKPTKVPYQMRGDLAKANDPETWGKFEEAMHRYTLGAWSGIGWEFSPEDPYCGIDLDGGRDPSTGKLEPWAKEIVMRFRTYTEVSPSETGVKLWCRGAWPSEGHKKPVPDAAKITDKNPAIEGYDRGRFFTMTGMVLAKGFDAIQDCQPQIDWLREKYWPAAVTLAPGVNWRSEEAVTERARKYLSRMDVSISGQDGHTAAYKAACAMVCGFGLPSDDALGLLREWNQGCQPPWSERELQHKVSQAEKSTGDRNYLRNASPDNYSKITQPLHNAPPERSQRGNDTEAKPGTPDVRVTLLADAARAKHAAMMAGKNPMFDLGLPDLDYAIGGGVEPGEMIIFAGRPSHCKTMVAQQAAYTFNAAGIPVVFISEEMTNESLGKRAIHYATQVPQESWSTRADTVAADIDRLFEGHAPCYVVEGCRSVDRVCDQIRKHVSEHGCGLAIVDYAQKLTSGANKARYQEITEVSIAIKAVLLECNIPGIILCQMSRSIESRGTFAPVMSDLKETGQFEQDADVIIFQVWPHKIDPEQPKDEYMLYVAKNRNRETLQHVIKCKIEPGRQRIVSERAAPVDPPAASDMDDFYAAATGEFH